MPIALAITQILIPLLPTITTGVGSLINFIGAVRNAAMQTGEWTPEIEAAYRKSLWDTTKDPAYQPDTLPPS